MQLNRWLQEICGMQVNALQNQIACLPALQAMANMENSP